MDFFDRYLEKEEKRKARKKKQLQILWIAMIFGIFAILFLNAITKDNVVCPTKKPQQVKTSLTMA